MVLQIPKEVSVARADSRQRARLSIPQIALVALLGLWLLPCGAQIRLHCEITTFGLLDLAHGPHAASATGNVPRGPRITSTTDRIPLSLNVAFGIRTAILGRYPRPDTDYQVIWHVPQRVDPDTGKTITRYVTDDHTRLGRSLYPWFRFESDWELIPGSYRVDIVHGDRPLCSKTFQVEPEVALTADIHP